ncbi:GNAT family N-acetyltransferase [Halobacteria archaeon AArc-m2/3/4]|uniref:GNAT family N-acetyltransferase n=1 Tax=Natronoglomus mannanivorans TaxID=2979990 RepID=A0AAP3E4B0_9EURY|nr:GNAT family N-acetyltransferase [Halobacteria archaeon AArc-xg1-1]MCU4974418.1 GNAT family N-acetyltransferase [Halobacteria archaeon AArc-m2/3/4]
MTRETDSGSGPDSAPNPGSDSYSDSDSDPDPIPLRPATPADGEALVEVHVASIRELGPAGYDPEQVEAWAANKRPDRYPLGDESTHAVVAEAGPESDEIAGFGWVDLEAGEVTAVYVHPDHARRGVGGTILEHLETAAREAGLESLGLTASVNAAPFYERFGYEPVEHVDHDINGEILECVRMRTALED